jgi:hypothetical protein
LTLVVDQLKELGTYCEITVTAFFDAVMGTALQCAGLSKSISVKVKPIPES